MPRRSLKTLFAILLSFLLSSCAQVKLKDGRVCGDMGSLGATCDNVFSDYPIDFDRNSWDRVRVGQLCMQADLFANWKAALIKFCNDTGRCTIEEVQAIQQVGKKIERLNRKVRSLSE